MPGKLPGLQRELRHLTPDEQKLVFGRDAQTGAWVEPNIEDYNRTVSHIKGEVEERPGATFGGVEDLPLVDSTAVDHQFATMPLSDVMGDLDRAAFDADTPVTDFDPSYPDAEFRSEDDMLSHAQRRAGLVYDPQIEALEREMEMADLRGDELRGELDQAYERAKRDVETMTRSEKQSMAETMRRRGAYDSGMAMDLTARISQAGMQMGMDLAEEQARKLADLAKYLDLQERHTREEIRSIMGRKAEEAEAMLYEMEMDQQTRRDQLAQQDFQNWLAEQSLNLDAERAMMERLGFESDIEHRDWQRGFTEDQAALDEYWRSEEFDVGLRDRQRDDYWRGREFDMREHESAWNRIMAMNQWEAEQALEELVINNQISETEFDQAITLGDMAMKEALYRAQYG